jgi:hypothetical protein
MAVADVVNTAGVGMFEGCEADCGQILGMDEIDIFE